MKNKKIRLMCMTSVFTALVFVVTAYLHIPTNNGYIHVGDGLIYLAACLLPYPYSIAVGACGALLADCLTGFAVWAPGSVIIKSITVLFFSWKKDTIINSRNLLMLIPSAMLCAVGYYLYESLIYWNYISALTGILPSLMQSLASSIVFIVLGLSIDKMNLKSKINGEKNR